MSTNLSEPLNNVEEHRPDAAFRPVRFAKVDIDRQTRSDGTVLVTNRIPLNSLPVQQIGEYLRRYAAQRPQHTFLAEPLAAGGWKRINYQAALAQVNSLSQWLLDRQLPVERPIFILSENSIHHALLQLAAMQIGIAVLPISPAYSLMSQTCSKIADLVQRFNPSLIYVNDAHRYARALAVAKPLSDAAILYDTSDQCLEGFCFAEALDTRATTDVELAFGKVGLDTTARLLLTSGSTGSPKAVIMTQRNIIASGVLWDQVWPFLSDKPLVMVDWLPWNHTAGSHGSFSMVLRHGGTLYIDDGKPMPKHIDRTIQHLCEIRPNVMVNVPRGLDMLVSRLEEDAALGAAIFPNLDIIVYGGASLSASTLIKLEQLSAQATGYRIPISSSLGSTETTMPATLIWWSPKTLGTLGLPAPGVETKLIPDGDRYEVRFRGPSITPGYYLDDDANRATFDDEGFLKTGDAVTFADENAPEQGLMYAGRLSENFKLSSGTWVSVATVRSHLLAHLHPYVNDIVLAEPNRDQLGALLFLNTAQIRKKFLELADASAPEIACHQPLLVLIAQCITSYNTSFPGNSTYIARALLLDTPPSIDAAEITDKGNINQAEVLKRRADIVTRLYQAQSDAKDCLVFVADR